MLEQLEPMYVGATLGERGARVSARNAGQVLRAYALDSVDGRGWLGAPPTDRVADGGFVLLRPIPRVLLIELKGADVRHALTQLRTTALLVQARLREAGCDDLARRVLAVVVATGTAPAGHARLLLEFNRATGARVQLKTGVKGSVDIRELLRLFDITLDF